MNTLKNNDDFREIKTKRPKQEYHSYLTKNKNFKRSYIKSLQIKGIRRKKYIDGKQFKGVRIRFDVKNLYFAHAYDLKSNKRTTIRVGYPNVNLLIDHLRFYGFFIEKGMNTCPFLVKQAIRTYRREKIKIKQQLITNYFFSMIKKEKTNVKT